MLIVKKNTFYKSLEKVKQSKHIRLFGTQIGGSPENDSIVEAYGALYDLTALVPYSFDQAENDLNTRIVPNIKDFYLEWPHFSYQPTLKKV